MSKEHVATVIIPTFNRANFLKQAIETAINQTVSCEIIVCDHGSSDNTPEIVAQYGSRVVYLKRSRDFGPFFSWLDGVLHASTEYVHFTFDDDWIDLSFIEKALSLFESECAFVFSAVTLHTDGKISYIYKDKFATGIHNTNKIETFLLALPLTISPGCALFRKRDILPAMMVAHYQMPKLSTTVQDAIFLCFYCRFFIIINLGSLMNPWPIFLLTKVPSP